MIIFKGPVVSELTFNSCLVEWQPAKLNSINSSVENIESSNADLLEYCLQLQSVKKESDYKEIYKGDSCSFRLKNLEPGIEYNVRVCAVRVFNSDSNSNRLCSSFTSHTSFITLKVSNRLSQHKKMLTGSDVAKSASVSSFSRFSRLLLPSFYLNLNTSKSSKQQTVLTFSQNNNQKMQTNIGKKSLVQKSTNRKTSDPAILNNASLLQENISSRQITDQQWAFLFIIILVIIAFLIAYAVNSFLASYYDLTSEL